MSATNTTEPIKLKAVGEKHTLDVVRCRKLPFGKRPELEFEGKDGSLVWMPEPSALRQLGRCELTVESVVGKRITIKREKSDDPAKPYWGIYLEDGAEPSKGGASNGAAATTQPAATTQARPVTRQQVEQAFDAEPVEKEKASAIYKRMTEWVLSDIVPLYANKGIPLDMQAIASITATLFINTQGRR
jgi:hypothetical protein